MSTGQLIVGGVRSATCTTCAQVAVLPPLSVTVQVTVLVPVGNDAGRSFTTLKTPHASEVADVPREMPVAVHPVFVPTFKFAGQVMVGGVTSSTLSAFMQLALLPAWSVTVSVAEAPDMAMMLRLSMPKFMWREVEPPPPTRPKPRRMLCPGGMVTGMVCVCPRAESDRASISASVSHRWASLLFMIAALVIDGPVATAVPKPFGPGPSASRYHSRSAERGVPLVKCTYGTSMS